MSGQSIKISDIVSRFSGKQDDVSVSAWLEKVELAAKLLKIDQVETVIPLFLEGQAFEVYQGLPDSVKGSAKSLKEGLIKAFGISPFQAFETLKTRVLQPGEAPDAFAADLRRLAGLMGCAPGATERIVVCQFVSGLPESCRQVVKSMKLGTELALDDVVTCAKSVLMERSEPRTMTYGMAAGRPESTKQSRAFLNTMGEPSRCTGCGRQGHRRPDCQVRCYRCGEKGHVRARCPGNELGEVRTAPAASQEGIC